jgi:hypothetical protein
MGVIAGRRRRLAGGGDHITLQIAPSGTSGGNSVEVEKVSVMRTIPPNRGISVALVPVGAGRFAPHYGRINSWCGALDYELNNGRYILGYINRRDIADSLRAIPSLSVPNDEELGSFDAFMKGPLN